MSQGWGTWNQDLEAASQCPGRNRTEPQICQCCAEAVYSLFHSPQPPQVFSAPPDSQAEAAMGEPIPQSGREITGMWNSARSLNTLRP